MTRSEMPVRASSGRGRAPWLHRGVVWAVVVVAGVGSSLSLVLGVAAALPGAGLFTGIGGLLFPTFGPWLVVLAIVATAFVAWRRRRRSPRRTSTALTAVGATAVVLNVLLVTVFCVQVANAGGSANPFTALALGSISAGAPDTKTSYTTTDGTTFPVDMWRPARSASPSPVLFYIHGGGWIEGAPSDGGAEWTWFARHGWLVVDVGYQLATSTSATWDRAPAQLSCALAWAGSAVARYGGDASRLVVVGDSAGGNLAVNLAYGAASGATTSACGTLPAVRAVAVQYPVVDPIGTWDAGFAVGSDPGSNARTFLRWYAGGSPDQYPERYRAIASATYLSRMAPPTLVISPDHDSLVPPGGVRAFVRQARSAGVDVTQVDIPFANHAYDSSAARSLGSQARLTIMNNWLQQHLGPR